MPSRIFVFPCPLLPTIILTPSPSSMREDVCLRNLRAEAVLNARKIITAIFIREMG